MTSKSISVSVASVLLLSTCVSSDAMDFTGEQAPRLQYQTRNQVRADLKRSQDSNTHVEQRQLKRSRTDQFAQSPATIPSQPQPFLTFHPYQGNQHRPIQIYDFGMRQMDVNQPQNIVSFNPIEINSRFSYNDVLKQQQIISNLNFELAQANKRYLNQNNEISLFRLPIDRINVDQAVDLLHHYCLSENQSVEQRVDTLDNVIRMIPTLFQSQMTLDQISCSFSTQELQIQELTDRLQNLMIGVNMQQKKIDEFFAKTTTNPMMITKEQKIKTIHEKRIRERENAALRIKGYEAAIQDFISSFK